MEPAPKRFSMGPIFGTQENFERYRITNLVQGRADLLRHKPPRLVLTGYGNFKEQTEQMHRRLEALRVPHRYDNQTRRRHDWHSGWFLETVRHLMAKAEEGKP